MKEVISLYSISPSHRKAQSSDYYIIRLFNPPTKDVTSLQRIYQGMFPKRESGNEMPIGPFYDVADLDRYCFKITQQFNLKGIGLLELERYNRLVEETHNLLELKTNLFKKCDYIENPDYKKVGILKRLLN